MGFLVVLDNVEIFGVLLVWLCIVLSEGYSLLKEMVGGEVLERLCVFLLLLLCELLEWIEILGIFVKFNEVSFLVLNRFFILLFVLESGVLLLLVEYLLDVLLFEVFCVMGCGLVLLVVVFWFKEIINLLNMVRLVLVLILGMGKGF